MLHIIRIYSSINTKGNGPSILFFFFFNDTATTEIYTLSLHDALPIWSPARRMRWIAMRRSSASGRNPPRSEEHTSELQSQSNLVCRLLLEKKKKRKNHLVIHTSHHTDCQSDHVYTNACSDPACPRRLH